jgi:hypothetical protein
MTDNQKKNETEFELDGFSVQRAFEVLVASTNHTFALGDTGDGVRISFTERHYVIPESYGENWVYFPSDTSNLTLTVDELDYLVSQLQLAQKAIREQKTDWLLHESGSLSEM